MVGDGATGRSRRQASHASSGGRVALGVVRTNDPQGRQHVRGHEGKLRDSLARLQRLVAGTIAGAYRPALVIPLLRATTALGDGPGKGAEVVGARVSTAAAEDELAH